MEKEPKQIRGPRKQAECIDAEDEAAVCDDVAILDCDGTEVNAEEDHLDLLEIVDEMARTLHEEDHESAGLTKAAAGDGTVEGPTNGTPMESTHNTSILLEMPMHTRIDTENIVWDYGRSVPKAIGKIYICGNRR